MAPRPNWKGYLKLALVTCPVALFTAASAADRISFHTLNRATGHRVKRQYIDAESGEVVEDAEQVKGYEVGDGEYVQIEDDEYDQVALESTHTIVIDTFVPRSQVDEIYIDAPYYLVPTDKVGEEAFVVIREAMRVRRMAGLARVVLFRRERILLLEPRDKGILAHTLHYASEVRDDQSYFAEIGDVEPADELIDLAGHIIDTKKSRFEPAQFEDRYEAALVELVRAKAKGRKPKGPAKPKKADKVGNLMEALRRSLASSNDNRLEGEDGNAKPRTGKKPPAKPARRRAG